jgi:hypothetical protein
MTRFLSESLKAEEPFFSVFLRQVEAARGHRNDDIRLSARVRQETQAKLRELGLDPADTTPEELYHALHERLKADDLRLTRRLRTLAATHVSADAEVVSGMVHALKDLPDSKRCFALKSSSLRTIFKDLPPKKAMKNLGYRSMASFLKHEDPVSVLAAAFLSEGITWQHKLLERYKRLTPGDFESRAMRIMRPDSLRWRELAASSVNRKKHNILCFKEAGALILLPLPETAPSGAVTASLALALHELNRIRSESTYLKLCQVRPDFGNLVKTVASDEPRLAVRLFDQPVSWHLIQRYYSELADRFREAVFEPHVRQEDMAWRSVEKSLTDIDPELAFWQGSAHLGMLDRHEPVSMNLVDAALNYCNGLPFERRITHYFRQSLWHELLLRYLDRDEVEQSIINTLQPELAKETVVAV